MATVPSRRMGVASRPVAIPDDVGNPEVVKASGVVDLPLNVRWSALSTPSASPTVETG